MARYFTTDSLIEDVKRRAMLPQSTQTFKPEDFLAFANEELELGVVPYIMSFHQDYLMFTVPVPLAPNQVRYEIPSRAMGNKIREVQYRDTSNNIYEMTRIFIEDLPYFQNSGYGTLSFYTESNEIVLTPTDNISGLSGDLLVSYYMRPNELVAEDRVARITAIDRTTGVISLDSYPENFTGVLGELYDFTSTRSPFKLLGFDMQPTAFGSITTPELTFDLGDIPDTLKVGDLASLAEETIIPQIPVELRSMLTQRVAIRCLEALGDTQGVQTAMVKLEEMEQKGGSLVDNRVEGAPLKIAPKHTFLRKSRTYMRR